MAYVAKAHLKWGDEMIAPGEPVPEGEEGRNYASLLRLGQIAEVKEAEQMSDAELAEAYEGLKAENARLRERIAEIEAEGEATVAVAAVSSEQAVIDEGAAAPEPESEPESGAEGEQLAETEAEAEPADTPEPEDKADPMEGVTPLGGGYYELPDGSKVRGRAAVEKALAETEAEAEG